MPAVLGYEVFNTEQEVRREISHEQFAFLEKAGADAVIIIDKKRYDITGDPSLNLNNNTVEIELNFLGDLEEQHEEEE